MTNRPKTPIRTRAIVAAALLAGVLALASCTARVTFDPSAIAPESVSTTEGAGYQIVRVPASRPASGLDVLTPGGGSFHVPASHYPAPGACRVWLPESTPGQQDAPGACNDLERQVPPGAYLIYG